MRGGPRPGAGRPRKPDPTTTAEAVAMLTAILGPGVSPSPSGERVMLNLDTVRVLLHKLRRRKTTNGDPHEHP